MPRIPYSAEWLRERGYDPKFADADTTDPAWLAEIERVRAARKATPPSLLSPTTLIKGAKGLAKAKLKIGAAPDAVREQRLAMCMACDQLRTLLGQPQCVLCKCLVKEKTKTADQSCPAGKWAAVQAVTRGGKKCGTC